MTFVDWLLANDLHLRSIHVKMVDRSSDEHPREGDFDEVYLLHNDSELESAESLDRFESDDETGMDLK